MERDRPGRNNRAASPSRGRGHGDNQGQNGTRGRRRGRAQDQIWGQGQGQGQDQCQEQVQGQGQVRGQGRNRRRGRVRVRVRGRFRGNPPEDAGEQGNPMNQGIPAIRGRRGRGGRAGSAPRGGTVSRGAPLPFRGEPLGRGNREHQPANMAPDTSRYNTRGRGAPHMGGPASNGSSPVSPVRPDPRRTRPAPPPAPPRPPACPQTLVPVPVTQSDFTVTDPKIFLDEAPSDKMLHQACLVLPTIIYRPVYALEGDIKTKLDQIRVTCGVWIDTPRGEEEDPDPIVRLVRVSADSKKKLSDAMRKILDAVLVTEEIDIGFHPVYTVEPTRLPPSDYNVELQIEPESRCYRAFMATQSQSSEMVSDEDFEAQMARLAQNFGDSFTKVAARMSQVAVEMRMRVHLGTFEMWGAMRDQVIYDHDQFTRIVKGLSRRASGVIKESLGDDTMANYVLSHMFRDSEHFEPSNTRIVRLEDTPARHSVILHLRSLIMEVEMNYLLASEDLPARYIPSQPRAFWTNRSQQKAEFMFACPERGVDWKLEILTSLSMKSTKKNIRELAKRISLLIQPGQEDPLPFLKPGVPVVDEVTKIVSKSTRTVQCIDTPYLVDFSTTRTWNDSSVKGEPEKSFEVSLSCDHWNDHMHGEDIAVHPRAWAKDLSVLFPPIEDGSGDGIRDFMDLVLKVRNVIAGKMAMMRQEATENQEAAENDDA